ncbi:unnamed protein product [Nezara viridula]|uniref:Serine protease HTRA2, mitochondrial n=1 Tax=Nezara viridula TaxID=85310 RepID=A0A9P0HNG4_NEZVI|nr:unnamed protein product [Nezara viridula]
MLARYRQFWKFLRYNKLFLPTSQKTALFYTAHEQSHHEEQRSKNLYKTRTLSIALLGIGFYYCTRKKEISLFPSVSAISLGSRRKQYNFIADVVEQSVNALVSIEIIDSRRYDFFTGQNITESNGSGFIISDDGLILTNAHVVLSRPATKLKIRLHDGTTYVGIVEDIDMKADLATVRINAGKKLPTMKLGSSEDARVGEWVIAMGSPLSLTNTITTGVISTVSRTSKDLKLFVQPDPTTNPSRPSHTTHTYHYHQIHPAPLKILSHPKNTKKPYTQFSTNHPTTQQKHTHKTTNPKSPTTITKPNKPPPPPKPQLHPPHPLPSILPNSIKFFTSQYNTKPRLKNQKKNNHIPNRPHIIHMPPP